MLFHFCGCWLHDVPTWVAGVALTVPGVGFAVRVVRARLGW